MYLWWFMWIIVANFEAENESTACVKALVGADCQLEVQQIIRILELGVACWRQCQLIYILQNGLFTNNEFLDQTFVMRSCAAEVFF